MTFPVWADPPLVAFVGAMVSIIVGLMLLLTTAERRHEPAALRRIHEPVRSRGNRRDLPRRFTAAPEAIGTTIVGGWGPQGGVGGSTSGAGDWAPGDGLPLIDAPVLHTPPPYSAHPVGMDVPIDADEPVGVGHPGTFVITPVVPVGASTVDRRQGRHLPVLSDEIVVPPSEAFPTGHAAGPPPVPGPSLVSVSSE
ncbi:MAG: hypothetical protein FJW94_14395 [Actinobacteria bacterium]|nr:hypothetical protein [Actinomycetota bacterium]